MIFSPAVSIMSEAGGSVVSSGMPAARLQHPTSPERQKGGGAGESDAENITAPEVGQRLFKFFGKLFLSSGMWRWVGGCSPYLVTEVSQSHTGWVVKEWGSPRALCLSGAVHYCKQNESLKQRLKLVDLNWHFQMLMVVLLSKNPREQETGNDNLRL